MILKCAACGGDMEINGDLPENVKIKCPHCGEKVRINKPRRVEVPLNPNLPRFLPDDGLPDQVPVRRRSDLHVRRPSPIIPAPAMPAKPPSRQNPCPRKRKDGGSGDRAIYALLAVVVAGLGIYWMRKSDTSVNADLAVSVQSGSIVGTDVDDEREKIRAERRAQEELERDKVRAERRDQEESEREKRRTEKVKRDAERARERQEMAEKMKQEREFREIVSKTEMSFNGASSVFASDFPIGKRPFDFAEDGIIIVADEDYIGERAFYRLTVDGKQLKAVRKISQQNGGMDIPPDSFVNAITSKVVLVKMESGPVWVCGGMKMNELMDVPESVDTYAPLSDFTGGVLPVLNALRAEPPAIKYRVTLKAKNGKDEIRLGIVEREIDIQSIRSRIRERLTDRKLKSAGLGVKPPVMKKFKRTVTFYEGEMIKTEVSGLIKVPRHYVYYGNGRGRTTAEERWKALAKKAREEDREEVAVEVENQRRMAEYRRKVDAVLHDSKPTEREVDAELRLYQLFIERSRTKLPKE